MVHYTVTKDEVTGSDSNSSELDSDGGKTVVATRVRGIRELFQNTKILVHILVCLFAIASWADINGMWAELPLLVETAKEGWTLPSYIIIISQVANIGPLIFIIISCLAPQTKPRLEKLTSFVVILVSLVACFLLAFLWEKTTVIGGVEHSTGLLTLNFFLAVGDCTSSVAFYAFMSHMKPEYMATLFIGEGLSGLIPALIALGQGAGDIKCNGTMAYSTGPNFSVQVYFLILSAIIFISAIAFLLLNFSSYCQSEMVQPSDGSASQQSQQSTTVYGTLGSHQASHPISSHLTPRAESDGHIDPYATADRNNPDASAVTIGNESPASSSNSSLVLFRQDDSHQTNRLGLFVMSFLKVSGLPLWRFVVVLAVIVTINMTLTTFLSTIQIYSVLPYGLEYYHLATTLPQITNPVACCFALLIMAENTAVIVTVTLLGQACVGYIIFLAAMSPTPSLQDETSGGPLAVFIWVLVTFMLVYAKVCAAGVLRRHGRNALIWGGACTQIGSLIGAIVGFVLVNEYKLFTDAPYCP